MLLIMLKNQPFSRSEDKNSSHFVFVFLVKVIVLFYILKNGKLRTELSSFVKTIHTGLPFKLFNFKWQAKNSRFFFLPLPTVLPCILILSCLYLSN